MERRDRSFESKNSRGSGPGLSGEARETQEDKGTGFTCLVYDVEHKRYHVACEDPETGRIRIECRCSEGAQEPGMSVSAA